MHVNIHINIIMNINIGIHINIKINISFNSTMPLALNHNNINAGRPAGRPPPWGVLEEATRLYFY